MIGQEELMAMLFVRRARCKQSVSKNGWDTPFSRAPLMRGAC